MIYFNIHRMLANEYLTNSEGEKVKIKVTVLIQKEDNWYVSKCVENSVASQGKTIEEAIANLKEALELYYEDEPQEIEHLETLITTMEIAI